MKLGKLASDHIGIVVGLVAAVLLVVVLCISMITWRLKRRTPEGERERERETKCLLAQDEVAKSSGHRYASAVQTCEFSSTIAIPYQKRKRDPTKFAE